MTWPHTSTAPGPPKLAPPLVKERGESRLVMSGKLLARNCWQLADSKLAASLGIDPDRRSWLDSSGCLGSGSSPWGCLRAFGRQDRRRGPSGPVRWVAFGSGRQQSTAAQLQPLARQPGLAQWHLASSKGQGKGRPGTLGAPEDEKPVRILGKKT